MLLGITCSGIGKKLLMSLRSACLRRYRFASQYTLSWDHPMVVTRWEWASKTTLVLGKPGRHEKSLVCPHCCRGLLLRVRAITKKLSVSIFSKLLVFPRPVASLGFKASEAWVPMYGHLSVFPQVSPPTCEERLYLAPVSLLRQEGTPPSSNKLSSGHIRISDYNYNGQLQRKTRGDLTVTRPVQPVSR